jgi:Ca2+-binding EF-hand superfamily protein
VFGKILRNEIDEEFRLVQKQLKETVAELLRVYLKGKYPLKRDDDITGIIKKRMAGHILEEEFVDIIKYMYNRDDSVAILLRLNDTREKQLMEYKESIRGSRHVIKPEDEQNAQKLAYAEFCKILLDFQLSGHEKFLHRFVALFRKFDQDRNGIVNEEEFTDVVDGVIGGDRQEELVEILNTCDPYDNKRVTFSQAVTALSGHLVAFNSAEMGH